jgi:peptidoglycan hydrolase CwlO-like protein
MEKNKTLFWGRLFFIILLSLFSFSLLYAQETNGAGKSNNETANENKSVSQEQFDTEISNIKNDLDALEKEFFQGTRAFFNDVSKKISQPQIWHIVLSVSAALISVTLLAFFVLLLLKILKFHAVAANVPKYEFDGKLQREHSVIEESRSTPAGISPAEFSMIKHRLDTVQFQLRELTDKVASQSKEAAYLNSNLTSLQSEVTDFKRKLKNSEDAFSSLKTDMDKNREKLARKEQVESDPVAAFNQWSQNPYLPFPQYFTYVTNVKLEFRTKQEFIDTGTETDWIRNTIGEKKFLFPNPNKIDSLSGPVDKLYKAVGIRKGKGANSVKVTNACQIKEGNFIEYQGELTFM